MRKITKFKKLNKTKIYHSVDSEKISYAFHKKAIRLLYRAILINLTTYQRTQDERRLLQFMKPIHQGPILLYVGLPHQPVHLMRQQSPEFRS